MMKHSHKSKFTGLLLRLAAAWLVLSTASLQANSPPDRYHPQALEDTAIRADLAAEAEGLTEFIARVGEPVEPVIVELDGTPGFIAATGSSSTGEDARQALAAYSAERFRHQDSVLSRLEGDGIEVLLRVNSSLQPNGRRYRRAYRFSYLMDGFVAYVPTSQVDTLRNHPDVVSVSPPLQGQLLLDNSVNHILGSDFEISDRRLATYGPTEELTPPGAPGHPEAPAPSAIDGFEGQGVIISIVDTGIDYFHPMFGGAGSLDTVSPQIPPAAADDPNRKVLYFYNLGGAISRDDFGHGTHVASTAAGYLVDGNTSPILGFGTGIDGTGIGPTPGGVTLHGVAPQSPMLAYVVCQATGNCVGDIELAIEDSVSPTILTGEGDGGAIDTGVPKPVADVINLSLGGGNDPAASSSRVANNAVLAGVTVVAAAGNDGPGEATVGAPCVGTLVLCVASALDPGSTAGSDELAAGETANDACADTEACSEPAPPAETGGDSDLNTVDPDGREGMTTFFMSGGGPLPGGSVSAHYAFVDRDREDVPGTVTGRIALLKGGTGTFFQIVNPVALLDPEAILLITDTESATAVLVANDVPVFTIGTDNGEHLLDRLLTFDDDSTDPAHGAVSAQPLRVANRVAIDTFDGTISGFSSRGPNANPNADFRTIKPDIAAPGSGVLAATTPEGNQNNVLGMASPTGYTTANGTSMASPHMAGTVALVRQRLRNLGLDATDPDDPEFVAKRFEASFLSRALLQNTATNLRSGRGAADPDGSGSVASILDMGSGLADIDKALDADAVMFTETTLFDESPDEFTPPDDPPPLATDDDGNFIVPLPTASYGRVEILGLNQTEERRIEVTIRDLTGAGGGTYDLALRDNRNIDMLDDVRIVDAEDSETEINTVELADGGTSEFAVVARLSGDAAIPAGSNIQWFLQAIHRDTGKRLRMPFYYRPDNAVLPEVTTPELTGTTGIEQPAGECLGDTDGSFTLNWTFSEPEDPDVEVTGFQIQRGTFEKREFFDDASEPLVAGANSLWSGSEQWTSQTNPDTGNLAYFVPNAIEQNESLAMIVPVTLPPGGASLSYVTNQSTEAGFDFAVTEISVDGGPWLQLDRSSGVFVGTRRFDLTAFAGSSVRIRFRMTSDLAVTDVGWFVEQIELASNDFSLFGTAAPGDRSFDAAPLADGEGLYRVGAIFRAPVGEFFGPLTDSVCVDSIGDLLFRDGFETILD